ncbi:hypothetical protein HK405_001805, partial [Cladochytrium tenue]
MHRTKAAEREMREKIAYVKGALSLRGKDVTDLELELASTKVQHAEAEAKPAGRLLPADAKDPEKTILNSALVNT